MTTDEELRELIDRARKLGVYVAFGTRCGKVSCVQIIGGIPGVSTKATKAMTPEIAAELLREFIAEQEAGL